MVSPRKIMAVTFTNKAANEMKTRLMSLSREIIDDLPTKNDILHIRDLERVGTFHSLFLKILKQDITTYNPDIKTPQHAQYRSNFSIYDSSESESVIKTILKEK
jgi:DNA helicase-2/ATP-dependent DNA helicase PcrA